MSGILAEWTQRLANVFKMSKAVMEARHTLNGTAAPEALTHAWTDRLICNLALISLRFLNATLDLGPSFSTISTLSEGLQLLGLR